MLARRSFLTGVAGLIAAPAIVRASSLMPVRSWGYAVPAQSAFRFRFGQPVFPVLMPTAEEILQMYRLQYPETVRFWRGQDACP